MTTTPPFSDEPSMPRPARDLHAMRAAVSALMPSRLQEYFEDTEKAFVRAGEEHSAVAIDQFYMKWAVLIEIERHPETARRLHAAETAINGLDLDARQRAIQEAGDIARAAHREVGVD